MWRELAALIGGDWRMPDLPGHGSNPPLPWDEAVAWVAEQAAGAAVVIGYSMGGRLALGAALKRPMRRLVLVSASTGIADPDRRRDRRRSDGLLADRIERLGSETFVAEWLQRPMGNEAAGLAAALRLLGRGAQPSLAGRLGEIAAPVLVVAGSADPAGVASAEAMAAGLPNGTLVVLPGVGHAVVGEAPEALAGTLAAWWESGPEPFTPEHTFD
jgi:pimeloyl-ACP methyl ester carboxylesterase